jgi:hypothetical protein
MQWIDLADMGRSSAVPLRGSPHPAALLASHGDGVGMDGAGRWG